jgi:hypothetical protein
MNSQQWLERFRAALKEQALPSWYVERLVRELQDHFDDLEVERSMKRITTQSRSSIGNPIKIAQDAGREFNRRGYFQRHPGAKYFMAASLLLLLFIVGGLLKASGAAAEYCVITEIKGKDGKMIASPKLLVGANDVANFGLQDGSNEYHVEVKAGDASEQARHSVQVSWLETDANGKKYPISAPKVQVSTDQTADVTVNGVGLHVCVAPQAIAK